MYIVKYDQIGSIFNRTELGDQSTKLGFDQFGRKVGVTKLGDQIRVKRVSSNWVTKLV